MVSIKSCSQWGWVECDFDAITLDYKSTSSWIRGLPDGWMHCRADTDMWTRNDQRLNCLLLHIPSYWRKQFLDIFATELVVVQDRTCKNRPWMDCALIWLFAFASPTWHSYMSSFKTVYTLAILTSAPSLSTKLIHSRPTSLSEQRESLARPQNKTDRSHNGSACERATRSTIMPSADIGEEPSLWVVKRRFMT